MLTQKYGEPRQCTETFHTPSQPVGDLEKMESVRQGKSDFKSYFEAEGGEIVLEIFHAKVGVSHFSMVLLSYIDDANAKLRAAAKGERRQLRIAAVSDIHLGHGIAAFRRGVPDLHHRGI